MNKHSTKSNGVKEKKLNEKKNKDSLCRNNFNLPEFDKEKYKLFFQTLIQKLTIPFLEQKKMSRSRIFTETQKNKKKKKKKRSKAY